MLAIIYLKAVGAIRHILLKIRHHKRKFMAKLSNIALSDYSGRYFLKVTTTDAGRQVMRYVHLAFGPGKLKS